MSTTTPTFLHSQLEKPPTFLEGRLVGNRLLLVSRVIKSKVRFPLTLIAYDALCTLSVNEPIYRLVKATPQSLSTSWERSHRPIIHQDNWSFLLLDPIIPGHSMCLPFSKSQRLVYLKQIGAGSHGLVYLTHDLQRSTPNRPQFSAVKVFPKPKDRKSRDNQEREIRLHLKVSQHPNIVTAHRAYMTNGRYSLVMGYHPGSGLDTFIMNELDFFLVNPEMVRSVLLQVLEAIRYLHMQGIYHCDIKPANIFVSEDGSRVYLGDFGFASQDKYATRDRYCGTVKYMSPETILGDNPSNERKDLWAFAMTALYLSLTGMVPWERALGVPKRHNTHSRFDRHYVEFCRNPHILRRRLPISEQFEDMLLEALDPEPSKRTTLEEMTFAVGQMRRFLMTPAELDTAEPESREAAVYIGLLQGVDAGFYLAERLESMGAKSESSKTVIAEGGEELDETFKPDISPVTSPYAIFEDLYPSPKPSKPDSVSPLVIRPRTRGVHT